jgi:hypothetical protein
LKSALIYLLLGWLLLAACAGASGGAPDSASEMAPAEPGGVEPAATGTLPAAAAAAPPGAGEPTAAAGPPGAPTLPPGDRPPPGAEREFSTDFSRHTVSYAEILSGGPPKDGIPAIDRPQFVSVAEADGWLRPEEPVVFVQAGDDARAFPIQILMWHEIANAEIGGVPLVVTFCPLCNTAIAFERGFDGRVLDFGTTGRLRYSNLIMYDRQTETWWQQATGQAIAGAYAGQGLTFHPASIIGWEAFKTSFPGGLVLSRDTGYERAYGRNPYVGYDDISRSPFLYQGPRTPGALPPMARVVTVDLSGEAAAYPYDVLEQLGVVGDRVGGTDLVVFWAPGTASALDAGTVAGGRDVGAAAVFERSLGPQALTFEHQDGRIVDVQTGSTWTISGRAIDGPLAGQALTPVVAIEHFWFSWAAFRPDTRIYQP